MHTDPEDSRLAELAPIEPAASDEPPAKRPVQGMPFGWFWPMGIGAAMALVLRLIFSGGPGQLYSAMLGSFVYLTPALCGAVTVYMAERIERRSWGYYLWAPWVATALFVGGTLAVFIEGLICAAFIVPLFAVMGSIGGLAMGIVCRITHWPKQTLYGFALLPLVLGAIEPNLPNPDRFSNTSRTLFIAAPAERVWHELNAARDIRPAEVDGAWPTRSACRCRCRASRSTRPRAACARCGGRRTCTSRRSSPTGNPTAGCSGASVSRPTPFPPARSTTT